MTPGRRWDRAERGSGLAGLLGALVAAALVLTPLLEPWELRTQDIRFQRRGPRTTQARIVIAEATDETLKRWPEPLIAWGTHYAAAIRQARALGARWIGLDVVVMASAGGEGLRALQGALAGGHVVLASLRAAGQAPAEPLQELLFAHPEQTQNLGFVDTRPDLEPDGVVRHAAVFDREAGGLVPSFPTVLALRMRGQSPADPQALRALAGAAGDPRAEGSVWINYVGPPRTTFPYLPLERLVDGALTPTEQAQVRGAVVLIARTDSLAKDRVTGAGGREYDGIEVHAHTLATLLDGRPLRRAGRGWEALLAAALGVLAALALPFLPPGGGLALVLALGFAWWEAALSAFREDLLWPVAGPLLALGLAWIGHSSARLIEEQRRRRWVQGIFERYVSRSVAEYLLHHPERLRLGGAEGEASVLFLDIRGYTTASQGRSPAQVLDELNTFLREIVPVIDRSGGIVLQYTGDGLLAVFGGPRPVEKHAEAAVSAALAMVRVSRRISAARLARGDAPLRIGCSINTGPVVCGNRGAGERAEFAVVGDTVNLAARLEELNKLPEFNAEFPSEVIISGTTYDQLSPPPPTRGPRELPIRGRTGRVRVYQMEVAPEEESGDPVWRV